MVPKFTHVAAAAVAGAAALCPLCLDGSAGGNASEVSVVTSLLRETRADTARVRLAIKGMTCGSCATTARIALERSDGVYRAEVSYDSASALVHYDSERTSPPQFIAALKKMTGYDAAVVPEASKGERE